MATKLKRLTFVVTPEIESQLNMAKKEVFYHQTKSDMIRELISAGLKTLETEKTEEKEGV